MKINVNATSAQDLDDYIRLFDKAVKVGADSVRFDLRWDLVELTPGAYDWGFYDLVYAELTSRGLEGLAVVHYAPSFYLPSDTPDPKETGVNEYAPNDTSFPELAAFLATVNVNYAACQIQVFNEVDNDAFFKLTPSMNNWTKANLYSQMLKVIKDEQPQLASKIVHASLMEPNHIFLWQMGEWNPDHLNTFDKFAVSAYHFGTTGGVRPVDAPVFVDDGQGYNVGGVAGDYHYLPYIKNLENFFALSGVTKEIIVSEYGYITAEGSPHAITDDEAYEMGRDALEWLTQNTGVAEVYWYALEDAVHGFGIWDTQPSQVAALTWMHNNTE